MYFLARKGYLLKTLIIFVLSALVLHLIMGKYTKTEVLIKNNKNTDIASAKVSNNNDFTDPGKWTILLTVNNGFYDIFENWWWYFKKLNTTVNIIVIAEDDRVFDKLNKNYRMPSVVIVRSWILNISSAVNFNTDGYNKIVSARPVYIKKYLEQSINVLIADMDTLFLKNPFQHFKGNFDIWGQGEKHGTFICPGLMAIKSSEKTVNIMKEWNSKLIKKLQRNMPAFNEVIRQHISDLQINHLSEKKFVGGPTFTSMSQKQRSEVVVLHATFCLGHEGKYNCFKKWKLWAFD